MEKEKQLLRLCCLHIEHAVQWGDSDAWTNDDFERLGEKIFEKTRVQLSISTLKRIWGKVRYENFPTTATLNALAGFLGYESWREFKQKNDGPALSTSKTAPDAELVPEPVAAPLIHVKPKRYGLFALLAGAMIMVLALFFVAGKRKPATVDPSKIKFSAVKVSDTLPNSVIFNYEASAFKSDSVFIQQSWDPRRREQVDGYGKQHTSIYYRPGYFQAKLIVNGKIEKECVVNIQTKGWKGIIDKEPVPIYLSPKDCRNEGFMGTPAATLLQKTGSPVYNDVWTKYANVRDFKGIDANNFMLETTLRNTSAVEACICRRANVLILLKGSAMIIPLCDKGCISNINLFTGENMISGRDHDLSAFGCDFNNFQHLKFGVASHHLTAYLNGKQAINIALQGKLGDVAGIRFEFEGAGEVKDVHLSTPGAGKYEEVF